MSLPLSPSLLNLSSFSLPNHITTLTQLCSTLTRLTEILSKPAYYKPPHLRTHFSVPLSPLPSTLQHLFKPIIKKVTAINDEIHVINKFVPSNPDWKPKFTIRILTPITPINPDPPTPLVQTTQNINVRKRKIADEKLVEPLNEYKLENFSEFTSKNRLKMDKSSFPLYFEPYLKRQIVIHYIRRNYYNQKIINTISTINEWDKLPPDITKSLQSFLVSFVMDPFYACARLRESMPTL